MKKRRLLSWLLVLFTVFTLFENSFTSQASSYSWMATATKIPINTQTGFQELKPEDYLNPTLDDAFYFYLPCDLYVNIVLKVKGSRTMDWKLYDSEGQRKGYSQKSFWKYDYNSDTNKCNCFVDLKKGGYYLKFDMWGCGRDSFFVSFLFKTMISTQTRVTSIKRGKNRLITIRWNKAPIADGYTIYRAIPGKKYVKIKEIKGNRTFTNITNVPKNKTYMYKVEAYKMVNGKRVVSAAWKSMKYNYKIK